MSEHYTKFVDAIDAIIAQTVFEQALGWLEELKAAPLPLPVGMAAKFKSFMPTRDLDELYAEECPYWHGYAATMQEFGELLDSLPKHEFKVKGKRA